MDLKLADTLHTATLLFQRRMRALLVASASPIAAVEAIVVARLYAYPDTSAGELSEIFSLSRSKISRLLIKLERLGFINANPVKEDRRNKRLSFTPAGQALLADLNWLDEKISMSRPKTG